MQDPDFISLFVLPLDPYLSHQIESLNLTTQWQAALALVSS